MVYRERIEDIRRKRNRSRNHVGRNLFGQGTRRRAETLRAIKKAISEYRAYQGNRKISMGKVKQMNKRELAKLRKWTDTLTDEELKKEYYESMFDCLGSQCDEMYERGYPIEDIQERAKFEKYLSRREEMLAVICEERKIKLFE